MQKGRPRVTESTINADFIKYYNMYMRGDINRKELIKLTDLSTQTIWRYSLILGGKEVKSNDITRN